MQIYPKNVFMDCSWLKITKTYFTEAPTDSLKKNKVKVRSCLMLSVSYNAAVDKIIFQISVPYGQFHCFTIFSVLIKGCWDAAKENT